MTQIRMSVEVLGVFVFHSRFWFSHTRQFVGWLPLFGVIILTGCLKNYCWVVKKKGPFPEVQFRERAGGFLSIGLRSYPQVRLYPLMSFREFLRYLLILYRGCNDHIFTLFPIGRSGHAVLGRELQAVDNAEQLVEVPSGGSRVGDHQFHFLVRPDDKYLTNGEFVRRIRVNHPVEVGDPEFGIGNQRKVHFSILGFIDVFDPFFVGVKRIDTDGNYLGVSFFKLPTEFGNGTKFCRANGCEIGRV